MSRKTGLVWHELYMWHNTGKYAGVMPPGLQVQPYEHSESYVLSTDLCHTLLT